MSTLTTTVQPSRTYVTREWKGWSISWDYGEWEAIGPNYDASWEGEETGWVDNGERVYASTLLDLGCEIMAYIKENSK